ncbi:hypothetical protein [Streptomyces sp. SP2-10]|uniref:hypothetical protein n=1 Tax=Streptomyces sp. SP2-10 TaxID=2873385 RepID=UPI0027E0FBC8|nr:hypothetical protein [Streptomyces sp. SP2-10]
MTSSLIRGRPRRATAHIRMRVAHAVLGTLAGAGWLALPVMTVEAHDPVPAAPVGAVASAAAPLQDGTSAADLVMPLVAGVAAVALAGYGYVRRTRRARTRTTPGTVSAHPRVPSPTDSERQARAALRLADDCVRSSREELSFVRERFGDKWTEPFTQALRAAETELSAAFAIWRQYEAGVPEEASARRQALAGVIGRCAEAGRRLDAESAALDRMRGFVADEPGAGGEGRVASADADVHAADVGGAGAGPEAAKERADAAPEAVKEEVGATPEVAKELGSATPGVAKKRGDAVPEVAGEGTGAAPAVAVGGIGGALLVAEGRFRELAARVVTAQRTLAALHESYAPSAAGSVTGFVEQAKDRLVFATARLNAARQAADAGDSRRAARQLRAGEGAVAQAGVLVGGVERLAAQLREAAELVPAVSAGAEADLARVRGGAEGTSLTPGELHARLAHVDGVLAAVRAELSGGAYDPMDALRRITRAVERLEGAGSGVPDTAALLVARSSVAGAEEFVGVHRGAVDAEARARLAEAVRELGAGNAGRADAVAGEARELAERDVRAHGTPYVGATGDTTGLAGTGADRAGFAGAVLGGILLAEEADGGPPAGFGGPRTRSRHHA